MCYRNIGWCCRQIRFSFWRCYRQIGFAGIDITLEKQQILLQWYNNVCKILVHNQYIEIPVRNISMFSQNYLLVSSFSLFYYCGEKSKSYKNILHHKINGPFVKRTCVLIQASYLRRKQWNIEKSNPRAIQVYGHIVFPIGPKNTNFVEDVEILLLVKLRWIPLNGFREEVENVSVDQRPGRPS